MRSLLLVLSLGACDPVWRVENVATAQPTTRVDPTCIDASLSAWGGPNERLDTRDPQMSTWTVGTLPNQMQITWRPQWPGLVELGTRGVGGYASTETVEAYRDLRDAVLDKVVETCGPLETVGPDQCVRADC